MKISDLFESASSLPPAKPGYIRLYRGDATKISKFDQSKTSTLSLFGSGIYLTDNRRVAGDYTSKNAQGADIIFRMSGRNLTKKQVLDRFINYMARTIDINGVDHSNEIQYWGGKAIPFSNGSDWTYHNSQTEPEREIRINYALKKWQQMAKHYEVRIKLDGSAVIQRKLPKSNSAISVFDIPAAYVAKVFHADYPISGKVLDEISWILERYHDKETATDIANFVNHQKREGEHVTFRQIYTRLTENCPLVDDLAAQKEFQQALMIDGYVGIEYSGGISMGGGYRHRAFVFWDVKRINRFRKSIG